MAYEKNDRRPNRKGRKKVCAFCVDKVECIDYKDTVCVRKRRLWPFYFLPQMRWPYFFLFALHGGTDVITLYL